MEWLNYHHLYYFWVVCKEGGFSKAATKLRISQSAVSLQISKLEDHLGQKLMDRGPRGFRLTESGQIALAQADSIFRQGTDLLKYFRSGRSKASFRLGALGGLSKNLQLKILAEVLADATVELSLEVGDAPVLVDRLINYRLDAILSDAPMPSSEAEPLIQKEIASEIVCLVCRDRLRRTDLAGLRMVLTKGVYLPARSSPVTSALLEILSAETESLHVRGYIDDIAFLRLLALETGALVAIPKIGIRRELESKKLTVVHEFQKIRQRYFLVYRQRGQRHPILKRLLDI